MHQISLKYFLLIAAVVFFISCSKDEEFEGNIYPKFNASLKYDSTTVIFSKLSSRSDNLVGKELTGCLSTDNRQQLCIRFTFDTLLSSIDLEDSLTGKTFYFTTNNEHPKILLEHVLDNSDYNTFRCQYDLGSDFFIHISHVQQLPEGDKINNVRIIPWAISGNFKARIKNASGVYENTTGDFLMLMEYYIVQ